MINRRGNSTRRRNPRMCRASSTYVLDENDFLRAAVGAVASSVPRASMDPSRQSGRTSAVFLSFGQAQAGRTAHFFGRLTPAKELRGPGKVVAFLEGKRFQQSSEESRVILIEDSFDCVAFDGDLFIMNPLGFESLFAYATSLSQNANATIDSVQSYIDPALIGGLRSEVGSNRVYMRRLAGRIQVDLAHLGMRPSALPSRNTTSMCESTNPGAGSGSASTERRSEGPHSTVD